MFIHHGLKQESPSILFFVEVLLISLNSGMTSSLYLLPVSAGYSSVRIHYVQFSYGDIFISLPERYYISTQIL